MGDLYPELPEEIAMFLLEIGKNRKVEWVSERRHFLRILTISLCAV